MKKRIVSSLILVCVVVGSFSAGVLATNSLEEIKAYLNYGITIKLDGQTQIMHDEAGDRVYPITYSGTTYVPIRAVSNMLGIDVEWDGKNNAVLLGETGAKDFLVDIEPYARDGAYRMTLEDASPEEIAGETYYNYISMGNMAHSEGELFYNLEGKYKTLTLTVYNMSDDDHLISFYGDNDALLKSDKVIGMNLPKTITVDVENVMQLTLKGHRYTYIIDGTIE